MFNWPLVFSLIYNTTICPYAASKVDTAMAPKERCTNLVRRLSGKGGRFLPRRHAVGKRRSSMQSIVADISLFSKHSGYLPRKLILGVGDQKAFVAYVHKTYPEAKGVVGEADEGHLAWFVYPDGNKWSTWFMWLSEEKDNLIVHEAVHAAQTLLDAHEIQNEEVMSIAVETVFTAVKEALKENKAHRATIGV